MTYIVRYMYLYFLGTCKSCRTGRGHIVAAAHLQLVRNEIM